MYIPSYYDDANARYRAYREQLAPNERRQGEMIFEVFAEWHECGNVLRLELFKEFR